MINHIVLFKLKEENKKENKSKLIEGLYCLGHEFDIEIGEYYNTEDKAWDLSIFSKFENEEELEKYNKNSDHLLVKTFVKKVCSDTATVDYAD